MGNNKGKYIHICNIGRNGVTGVIAKEKLPQNVERFWKFICPPDPKKKGRFGRWLMVQIKTHKTILDQHEMDFALDVQDNKKWRDFKRWSELETHLVFNRAVPEAIAAAKRVFKKWCENDPQARFDGMSAKDVANLRKATRQVWSWSLPRKICIERSIDLDGFYKCEGCRDRVPRVHVDHIVPVGHLDGGYFERLYVTADGLQALCQKCHSAKTKAERKRKPRKFKKVTRSKDDSKREFYKIPDFY